MASMYPYTDREDSMSLQDLAFMQEDRIPLAENGPCDTPQVALGVNGKLDQFGDCVDCGFPGSCHDY